MNRKNPSQKKKEIPTTPKGMRDIVDEEYYEYQGFFEKASEVAIYYGFKPIETPILEKEEVFTRSEQEGTDLIDKEMYTLRTKSGDRLSLRPEGTAAIMRAYLEHGMHTQPQPVMFYHYGPFFRHERPQYGRYRELRQFELDMLGTTKSVGDAIIIKTILNICEEAGIKNTLVTINSIGDKQCRPAYIKELTTYFKKHANELCPQCKQRLQTNPLRILDCKDARCEALKEDTPAPITHLCPECRQHFKEVLEYLEALEIPYEIDNTLVRGLDYYTRTVFEIFAMPTQKPAHAAKQADTHQQESQEHNAEDPANDNSPAKPLALAGGGRYDDLARALGSKKEVPAVGGGIGVDRLLMLEERKHLSPRVIKKPKIYFIQLGFEAKLKSLAVIDVLRKARIPIKQALSKDGLSVQLAQAEKSGIPYAIIFGQKEAHEHSVIVRDMNTHSQDTVPIEELPEYLKKLK